MSETKFLPLNVQNFILVLHSKGLYIKTFKEKLKTLTEPLQFTNQWNKYFKGTETFDLNINSHEICNEFTYVKKIMQVLKKQKY